MLALQFDSITLAARVRVKETQFQTIHETKDSTLSRLFWTYLTSVTTTTTTATTTTTSTAVAAAANEHTIVFGWIKFWTILQYDHLGIYYNTVAHQQFFNTMNHIVQHSTAKGIRHFVSCTQYIYLYMYIFGAHIQIQLITYSFHTQTFTHAHAHTLPNKQIHTHSYTASVHRKS